MALSIYPTFVQYRQWGVMEAKSSAPKEMDKVAHQAGILEFREEREVYSVHVFPRVSGCSKSLSLSTVHRSEVV